MTEFADQRRWQRSALPVGTVRTLGRRPRRPRFGTRDKPFLRILQFSFSASVGLIALALLEHFLETKYCFCRSSRYY